MNIVKTSLNQTNKQINFPQGLIDTPDQIYQDQLNHNKNKENKCSFRFF